jgi:hypothetical protein
MTPAPRGHRPDTSAVEPQILSLQAATQPTLRRLLEGIAADAARSLRDRGLPPVTVVLDVAEGHGVAADPVVLETLLRTAVLRAVDLSAVPPADREVPHIAEVVVTSIDLGDTVEIEIADAGPGLMATTRSVSEELRPHADRVGAEVTANDCPVGGTAVTIRFPRRRARSLAA